MTIFDLPFWYAVPLGYFFWLVVYPRLKNE